MYTIQFVYQQQQAQLAPDHKLSPVSQIKMALDEATGEQPQEVASQHPQEEQPSNYFTIIFSHFCIYRYVYRYNTP